MSMSPRIKAMLDFGPVYHQLSSYNNAPEYLFCIPANIYDTSETTSGILSIHQFSPHLSSLSNINRLLINSSNLNVFNDFVSSSNQLAGTSTLTDFTIAIDNA